MNKKSKSRWWLWSMVILFLLLTASFVFNFWIIKPLIQDINQRELGKYTYLEGESNIINGIMDRWRVTFKGGQKLLEVKINSLKVEDYDPNINYVIYDCTNYKYSENRVKKPIKIVNLSYTDIGYFGIPLKTETVFCKY